MGRCLGAFVPIAMLMIVATSVAQIEPMFSAPRFPAGDGVACAAVADFDSDGILDIVTADAEADTLSFLHGAGNATFYPRRVVGTAARPLRVVTADLNGDGFADVAATNADADRVTVHLGNGNGTLAPGIPVSVGKTPRPIAVGDINGDGRADIVVGNYDDGATMALIGDGQGGFTPSDAVLTGRWPVDIALADVDGDGLADAVVANTKDENVAVLRSIGHGQFAAPVFLPAAGPVNAVTLGDLDGDGLLDVATSVGLGNAGSYVQSGTGGGTFGPPSKVSDYGAARITAVDLDFDDDLDLVVSGTGTFKHKVAVLENDDRGNFSLAQFVAVGPTPSWLTVRDLDEDGDADLTAATEATNWFYDDVTVVRGLGDGSFDGSITLDVIGAYGTPILGDFDADGSLDVALATSGGHLQTVILPGHGNGQFGPPIGAVPPTFEPLLAVDYDADGLPDLVGQDKLNKQVRLLRSNGDLTFTHTQDLSLDALIGKVYILATDLSGDGVTDLALRGETTVIDLYMGLGDGTFPPEPDQSIAIDHLNRFVAGDINDDGLVDLVVNRSVGEFATVLGTGGGSFGPPSVPPGATTPSGSLGLADFDGDGSLDLVVGRNKASSPFGLSLFSGAGDGTFTLLDELLPGRSVAVVGLGDMDGDGVVDVFTTHDLIHLVDTTVAMIPGTGGPDMLGAPRLFGLPAQPDQNIPALGDVDNDGRVDLVILDVYDGLTVALSRPPGPWMLHEQDPAGEGAQPLLTGMGTLEAGSVVSLGVTSAASSSPAWLVVGSTLLALPFKGGTMIPSPDALVGPLLTNDVGVLSVSGHWPVGLPAALEVWLQAWVADARGPQGYAATNALKATTP